MSSEPPAPLSPPVVATPRKLSGLAVAAFVLSLLFFIPLSPLLGAMLGIVALVRHRPERRGRGLARDALTTLLRHLFAAGAHRIDAEVYAENERSQKLLEGLGFLREGLKREANFNGEGYSDIIAYGLLEEDLRRP